MMFDSIINRLKGIAEGWKIFFGLVGMVTVISTVAVKIDHIKNKKISNDVRIDRWINYDSLEHEQAKVFRSDISFELQNLAKTIDTLNRNMTGFSKVQFNLKDYMMNKAATKKDVLDILRVFEDEKKNNGNNLFPTVSVQKN